MLENDIRSEMLFYDENHDYSDAKRYERFALKCNLGAKGYEIGRVVRDLVCKTPHVGGHVEILETASATGLTAVGVSAVLTKARIAYVYTSLDIEQNLISYAMNHKRGDKFFCGDFEDLPYTDDYFDIYIMMGAEGYRTKGTFYSEVVRVLRCGGYCVMPMIGPHPHVSAKERGDALRAGLNVVRADNYLIAKKVK